MDRLKYLSFSCVIFLLLLLNFSTSLGIRSSFAALGEVEESVSSDQTKILGAKSSSSLSLHENYRMHEIKQNNQTVHEFANKDGKVFAVTWLGPVHPDFSVLFGTYFIDFQTAREQAHKQGIRRRSGTIEVGDFHLEYGGQMAAQRGRAWVKSILPKGFNTDDIR